MSPSHVKCLHPQCGKSFKYKSGLWKHSKFVHEKRRNVSCVFCGKCCWNTADLWKHLLPHIDERPYSCKTCDKAFCDPNSLRSHIETHHIILRPKYRCDLCGKSFISKGGLRIHVQSVHEKRKNLVCVFCGKTFFKHASYFDHLRQHVHEKPYACKICGKSFSVQSNYIRHVRTHTLETLFSCNVCGRSFNSKGNRDRHLKTVHEKSKEFSCIFCGKLFGSRADEMCHLLYHVKEKPFSCEICGNSFSMAGNRDQHLKTHTRDEKIYECQFCKTSARGKRAFRAHQIWHRKCSICGETFNYKDLKRHERTIHGMSRHCCVFCAKGFHGKSSFFYHLRNHIMEKPFQCQLCDASFFGSEASKKHLHRFHHRMLAE